MGWIKTLRNSSIGPAGTVRYVDGNSERVLVVLGIAEGVPDPRLAPKPKPEPKRVYRKKVVEAEEAPKPKRVYRRKDMEAEQPVEVVIQQPDPEPLEDPLKDDDEPVRV